MLHFGQQKNPANQIIDYISQMRSFITKDKLAVYFVNVSSA